MDVFPETASRQGHSILLNKHGTNRVKINMYIYINISVSKSVNKFYHKALP